MMTMITLMIMNKMMMIIVIMMKMIMLTIRATTLNYKAIKIKMEQ